MCWSTSFRVVIALLSDAVFIASLKFVRGRLWVELTDEGIYGSDDRSFKIALAREQQRKFQREDQKQQRIKELQEKEAEKQKSMLKMLGLSGIQPGQKITILPRKNG